MYFVFTSSSRVEGERVICSEREKDEMDDEKKGMESRLRFLYLNLNKTPPLSAARTRQLNRVKREKQARVKTKG
jgi:hypothetical protein